MNEREFNPLADAHRLRGPVREACRLVLVCGLSNKAAARQTGVAASSVGRALRRLRAGVCPTCGQPIRIRMDRNDGRNEQT